MKDNLVKQIYLLMEMQSFDGDVSHVHDSYKMEISDNVRTELYTKKDMKKASSY